MTVWTWIGVAALGGVGAVARFVIHREIGARTAGVAPVATFAINVSGAFALGLLDGLALSGNAMILAGTALLGSYTTFSTWMVETERLADSGEFVLGLANVAGSVAVGFAAVVLGRLIGVHA